MAQQKLLSPENLGFERKTVLNTCMKNQTTIMKLKDEEREQEQIKLALGKSGNNITLAAKLLGISRQALYTKLRKYQLK